MNAHGQLFDPREAKRDWPYLAAASQALKDDQFSPAAFRQVLDQGTLSLQERFGADEAVEDLVQDRARLVDITLRAAWARHAGRFADDLALVAVGGYGRGELHPCSDIDIMVLLPKSDAADWQSDIERFLAFLWDIGLEVGHSVRTIDDCQRESLADLSVASTLFEARLLTGPEPLFAGMRRALAPDRLWSSQDFFAAKVREQTERHHRYFDTAYNLEPNVKSSPGGLRDIQTIGWVAKRHFGTDTLDELVAHGFLTREELRKLKAGQSFLWKVRFGLHVLTGRREDRLLFDYQIKLAKMFGYEDASFTLAVEQLMQKYYRTVMDVSLLNEMLLQLFREAILTQSGPPVALNPRFQIRNDTLEVTHPEVFARHPSALLELFVLLQQHPELRGVRAETIRLIGTHIGLIDEEFRQNPRHHRLFLEILCAPVGVTHELRRMNLYGVLGRYIPAFGRVVGRMQYDLFHAYTVDAHTLFVVSNLRRLAMPKYNHEFPALSQIMQSLPRQEIAYLAALFHDIAKGRGGDHSELGAVDAEAFCLEQGLGRYEARLVAWLVRNHLILSITAQKKDISDPDVIHDFARRVGDQAHLDTLYVLTVADVRGTNPKLWNTWKARLFEEFYERTKRALRRGLETPLDQDELIRETQEQARARMPAIAPERVAEVWSQWTEAYFLRFTPEEIAWHTTLLADRDPREDAPLVAIRQLTDRGSTAVLTYSPGHLHSFARTTAVLDQMGLNVVDARLISSANGFSLETYVVLEAGGAVIAETDRIREIEAGLWRNLQQPESAPTIVTRRAPRQVRMFSTPTQVNFSLDARNHRTILELIAADRPGLLSEVGKVFKTECVLINGAKIMTVGERAEDVFYITGTDGRLLDPEACQRVQDSLMRALDRRDAAMT
ncbi:MAG TPA: [protein-PII] uridylyltransferase [Steroidobacteraceae bacterium]|nr:[protein-PII] uridylyltransferase [Steroidobacteraceae bacterium]